jgi:hypothetical protein
MAMKRKTFEMSQTLTEQFEQFCRTRCLIEKKVAAAALLHFMKLDPVTREKLIIDFEQTPEAQEEAEMFGDGRGENPREATARLRRARRDGHDGHDGHEGSSLGS